MTDPAFRADLEAITAEMTDARAALVSAVQRLSDADLDRARRGGWTIRRVLEHVIEFEWLCVMAITAIRKEEARGRPQTSCEGQLVDEILCMLDTARHALLGAFDGVDEETFYRLERMGREEYSVLSALENVAHHDREHSAQITAIASSS
jgi:uncharacterized damage-inducible protein DinB